MARVNNEIYNSDINWWEPDSPLYLLHSSVNPFRTRFSRDQIFNKLNIDPKNKKALDVGCGAGILSEEIARMGFDTYGVDPAKAAIEIAKQHAQKNSLTINYNLASGELLPYPDNYFDVVFCCDVLEHVDNFEKVIAEISRVLKSEGIFIFDTINRTWISKVVAIKIAQDWKPFAFMPADLHVYEKFITPEEIKRSLLATHFSAPSITGAKANLRPLQLLLYLYQRAKGRLTFKELGDRFKLVESDDTRIFYMGISVKK